MVLEPKSAKTPNLHSTHTSGRLLSQLNSLNLSLVYKKFFIRDYTKDNYIVSKVLSLLVGIKID